MHATQRVTGEWFNVKSRCCFCIISEFARSLVTFTAVAAVVGDAAVVDAAAWPLAAVARRGIAALVRNSPGVASACALAGAGLACGTTQSTLITIAWKCTYHSSDLQAWLTWPPRATEYVGWSLVCTCGLSACHDLSVMKHKKNHVSV